MQCTACGTDNRSGATNCVACGAELPKSVAAPDPQQPYLQQPYPQPPFQQQPYPLPPFQQTPYQQPYYVQPPVQVSSKSKVAAGILALFLGGLGAHKFYLGQTGMGIVYLLLCWTFIPSCIAFIEGIIYLTMTDQNFAAKYH